MSWRHAERAFAGVLHPEIVGLNALAGTGVSVAQTAAKPDLRVTPNVLPSSIVLPVPVTTSQVLNGCAVKYDARRSISQSVVGGQLNPYRRD